MKERKTYRSNRPTKSTFVNPHHVDVQLRMERIETEVRSLAELARQNPDIMRLTSPNPLEYSWLRSLPVELALTNTPGWVQRGQDVVVSKQHTFRVVFPVGYPSAIPFAVYSLPDHGLLHHPNVDPNTGAMCLFLPDQRGVDRTLCEAIVGLERLVLWQDRAGALNDMNVQAVEHWENRSEMRLLGPCRLSAPRLLFVGSRPRTGERRWKREGA